MKARRHLIAALSEGNRGGIATLLDVARAEQLVDAHRAEVLDEVTTWLTKHAREYRAAGSHVQGDTAAVLASKVNRGAVRPDNLRMLPNPGSFEADRTYRYGAWTFRCEKVTTHPDGGTPTAIGWIRGGDSGWSPYAYELAQWSADWTDVTEAGAR